MDILSDLDGTVANCSHRLHWIKNKPKNWKAFFTGIAFDMPIMPVIDIIKKLTVNNNRIIFCTGRPEDYRAESEKWINQHVMTDYKLYMRPFKDSRPDYIVKEELLSQMRIDGYNPLIAFEDRSSVRDMWIRNGIFVFDVSQGNGDF